MVTAETLDLSGRRLGDPQRQTLDVPASATAPAFTVPAAGDQLPLVRLLLATPTGMTLSRNTYWRCSKPTDLRALYQLSGAALHLTAARTTDRGDRLTTEATVRNSGTELAPMVRLSLRDRRRDERVLPAAYSENYLWLPPGESRTVTVSCPRGARRPGDLEITARGYGTATARARTGS